MGNSVSNIKENTSDVTDFLLKIDSLAAKFVTSSNISGSKKISDLYFCDDLVIMTSDILENKLTAMDLEHLKQRTEKGVVIDDMTTDKIIYFKKDQINNLDVKNKTDKRRICNGISKFYIKMNFFYVFDFFRIKRRKYDIFEVLLISLWRGHLLLAIQVFHIYKSYSPLYDYITRIDESP